MSPLSRFSILLLTLLPALVPAQSIIGRVAYQPDSGKASTSRLNPSSAWNELPPLPQVDIPDRLPAELGIPPDQFAAFRRIQAANTAISEGRAEEALSAYAAYLEKNEGATQVRVAMADSLFALDRYKEAERAYLKALESDPFHFQALNNLAWMYCEKEDSPVYQPEKSLKYATRAQLVLRTSHHVWSTLSQAYYELEQYREARNAARNALLLARRSPVSADVIVRYMVQLDTCAKAVAATSILE